MTTFSNRQHNKYNIRKHTRPQIYLSEQHPDGANIRALDDPPRPRRYSTAPQTFAAPLLDRRADGADVRAWAIHRVRAGTRPHRRRSPPGSSSAAPQTFAAPVLDRAADVRRAEGADVRALDDPPRPRRYSTAPQTFAAPSASAVPTVPTLAPWTIRRVRAATRPHRRRSPPGSSSAAPQTFAAPLLDRHADGADIRALDDPPRPRRYSTAPQTFAAQNPQHINSPKTDQTRRHPKQLPPQFSLVS